MAIEFRCTQCQKLLRTPDGTSGKQARCPQCGAVVAIPAASVSAGLQAALAGGAAVAADNPYSSPPPGLEQRPPEEHEFVPTRIEIGDVVGRTWEIFQRQWAICLAATFGMMLVLALALAPFIVMVVFAALAAEDNPLYVIAASIVLGIVAWVSSIWLTLGLHAVLLRIARGEPATLTDFFGEGPQVLSGCIVTLLVALAVTIGSCMLVVPGIILGLMFSQVINVLVDRRVGVIDALRLSMKATEGNKVTLFLLALAVWAVNAIGASLSFGLATIVITPFVALLGSVVYLTMTGQPTAYRQGVEHERSLGQPA